VALGNHVIDLEGCALVLLGHLTVFAAVAGSLPDQFFQRAVHACSVGLGLPVHTPSALESAAGLRVKDSKEAADTAVGFDLGLFLGAEGAGSRLGGQFVHAVLIGLVKSQGEEPFGGSRR
jgi:hypothetical protein